MQDKEIVISSHEFDLLILLSENAGNILSRDDLFIKLYNRPYDGLDRISYFVKHIVNYPTFS